MIRILRLDSHTMKRNITKQFWMCLATCKLQTNLLKYLALTE